MKLGYRRRGTEPPRKKKLKKECKDMMYERSECDVNVNEDREFIV
jgi:hypothetical protein